VGLLPKPQTLIWMDVSKSPIVCWRYWIFFNFFSIITRPHSLDLTIILFNGFLFNLFSVYIMSYPQACTSMSSLPNNLIEGLERGLSRFKSHICTPGVNADGQAWVRIYWILNLTTVSISLSLCLAVSLSLCLSISPPPYTPLFLSFSVLHSFCSGQI